VSKVQHRGWIGVDLDGTLAHYTGWKGEEHIGAPIPAMVARVQAWIAEGREVRIFTARISGSSAGDKGIDAMRLRIEAWCREHIGRALYVTNVKDYAMIELWDDRAVQVTPNTGERADGKEAR
jgi:hypothetical protein